MVECLLRAFRQALTGRMGIARVEGEEFEVVYI